jgi:hypothetical protein
MKMMELQNNMLLMLLELHKINIIDVSMVQCTYFMSKSEVHIASKVITHKISLTLNSFLNHIWCI